MALTVSGLLFRTGRLLDWQAAGLLKPSFAKPFVTTIEQSLVIHRMGILSLRDQQSLRQMFSRILG